MALQPHHGAAFDQVDQRRRHLHGEGFHPVQQQRPTGGQLEFTGPARQPLATADTEEFRGISPTGMALQLMIRNGYPALGPSL